MENYIIWIIVGLFVLPALTSAIKGYKRGIFRQLVRTFTVGLSAYLAVWLAKVPYEKYVVPFFEGKTTEQLVEDVRGLGVLPADLDLSILYNFDAETVKLLVILPVALILIPIIFLVFFSILQGLTMIVHVIVCGLLGFRKENNNALTRWLGMALGVVESLAVTSLMLTPVIGYAQVYSDSVSVLQEQMPDNETVVMLGDVYDGYVKDALESPVTQTVKKLGIDKLFNHLVTVKVDAETSVTMTNIIPDTTAIYAEAMKLKGADVKMMNSEQEAAVRAILARIDGNDYLATLISGAVRGASYCYTNGEFSFVIPAPFDSLLNEAISIFHTSDRENIVDDLNTLCDVFFVLSKDGVLQAFETDSSNLLDVMTAKNPETNSTPIKDIINSINSNERIKPLVKTLAKISVSVMSDSLNLGEEGAQLYEKVSEGLNDTLSISKEGKTEEEYVKEVSESISATLTENNIELEPEIIDTMAQYVSDNNLADSGASTEDLLITYFDAYLEYKENGTLPDDFPSDIPEGDGSGILPDDFLDGIIGGNSDIGDQSGNDGQGSDGANQ
jgi:uncharacterized membrane protein required for colicin V production